MWTAALLDDSVLLMNCCLRDCCCRLPCARLVGVQPRYRGRQHRKASEPSPVEAKVQARQAWHRQVTPMLLLQYYLYCEAGFWTAACPSDIPNACQLVAKDVKVSDKPFKNSGIIIYIHVYSQPTKKETKVSILLLIQAAKRTDGKG